MTFVTTRTRTVQSVRVDISFNRNQFLTRDEGIVVDTQRSDDVGVLSRVGVDEDTEEHVDDINERLGDEGGLPEGMRLTHLGHELDKDLGD